MNKFVSLAFVIGGIILLMLGYHEAHSANSMVSHWLTGSPSKESQWMMIAGAIATVAGLIGLSSSSK